MTEIQLRQNLVNTAKAYIGATKGSAQHVEIVNIYNTISPLPRSYKLKTSDAWCAGFASAMAKKCNLLDIIPAEVSCGYQISGWQKLGRWVENDAYVPSAGDYIYYDWDDSGSGDNKGSADHVGIVCEVSNGVITVIEGNKGSPSAVGYRNIAVNGRYIRGFGIPNFASKATAAPAAPAVTQAPTQPAPQKSTATVAKVLLPTVKSGSKGVYVEALQNMLIGLGYSCGKYGADGDFGASTKSAVIKFQNAHNLIPDGEVGALTWTALKTAMPNVARNSRNKCAKAMQILLNAAGFSCGTPDGVVGSVTYNEIIKFQKARGLSADGICGQKTWAVLIVGKV